MDCIIEDSPNMMGGVVYLGLELVDKLGIESTQIENRSIISQIVNC